MCRWSEEKILLLSETLWTLLYYEKKVSYWERWVTGTKDGKDCYAKKQAVLWQKLAQHAAAAYQIMTLHQD